MAGHKGGESRAGYQFHNEIGWSYIRAAIIINTDNIGMLIKPGHSGSFALKAQHRFFFAGKMRQEHFNGHLPV